MEDYGELLDGGYEPENDYIYNLFSKYFNNPNMTKIKNQGNYCLYASKIHCLLNRECRYVIAITNNDGKNIGTVEELRTMKWVSLQTRSLNENLNAVTHGYTAVAEGPLTAIIRRIDVSKEASTYSCDDLPIVVTLLHTEKKNSDSYQPKGTVIAALETYETIITLSV